jgi:uncharacterized membrane protein
MEKVVCAISGQTVSKGDSRRGDSLRAPLFTLIQASHPNFTHHSYIAFDVLNEYRRKYLTDIVEGEHGEVTQLEKDVLNSIQSNTILSENIEADIEEAFTTGQKVADRIATFGGSWPFIGIFFSFLVVWMLINIFLFSTKPFDPYPFILLNLILSCLAAIQAPIIMMSQNRKEQRDRIRSEHDYKVNLKAELEIKLLHEKIDHMIIHQNKRLLEIQEIQADYLQDILEHMKKE